MIKLEHDSGISIRDLFFDFNDNERLLKESPHNPKDPPAA